MRTYTQPDEYHFCQDSVLFAEWLAEQIKPIDPIDFAALDICAGCGIIGIETCALEPRLRQMDFLEIQSVFANSLEANFQLLPDRRFRHLACDYSELLKPEWYKKYDLIIGNPPYFQAGDGHLSPSEVNNRCRFFLDSDLPTLLLALAHALKDDGVGYLLMKSGVTHGRDQLRSARLELSGRAKITLVGDIRGTSIVSLRR